MHTCTYVYYRCASHVFAIGNTYCFLKAINGGPATWVDQPKFNARYKLDQRSLANTKKNIVICFTVH